jgi:hypothetical protein
MRGFGLRAVIVLTAGFLAGCAEPNQPVSTTAAPVPTNAAAVDSAGNDFAVVVIGESYTGRKVPGILPFIPTCPTMTTLWVPFGRQSMRPFRTSPIKCRVDTDDPVQYTVVKVTPGRYALQSLTHETFKAGGYGTTNANITTFAREGLTFDQLSVKFEARRGEIVYLGTFLYATLYPARLEDIVYDIAAADAAVKARPDIKGEMKVVRFERVPASQQTAPARPRIPIPPADDPPATNR